jgi:hypothetical protein
MHLSDLSRIAGVGLFYGSWAIQVYCFCVGRCMVQCVFRPGAGGGRLRLVAPGLKRISHSRPYVNNE